MADVRGSYNRILVSTIQELDVTYLDITPKDMENALATGADISLVWYENTSTYAHFDTYQLVLYERTSEEGCVATFADLTPGSVDLVRYVAETVSDRFKFITEP